MYPEKGNTIDLYLLFLRKMIFTSPIDTILGEDIRSAFGTNETTT
jgi:hypothetical protein